MRGHVNNDGGKVIHDNSVHDINVVAVINFHYSQLIFFEPPTLQKFLDL